MSKINAAPVPADLKRISIIVKGNPALPNALATGSSVRLARRDDAIDYALPTSSKHTSEDSASKIDEVELYPRASIRAAARANLEAIRAAGESAFKAIDSAGVKDVVGTSQTPETLKLNVKSKRITKPQKYQQRPLKTWTKKRLGAAEIDALTDAELREIVLDHPRGTWHGALPIETHKRILSVLPPRLPTGGKYRSKSSRNTLGEAKRIREFRHHMKKQIETMDLSAATTFASSPLVHASFAGSSQSPEALKIKVRYEAIAKALSRKQPLHSTKWSRSEWVDHIDSLNDAELVELILTRTNGGNRPVLPMRIYERMLKVLPPPLPRGKAAQQLDLTPETLKTASKVAEHRRRIKARISIIAPEAADAPLPTSIDLPLPLQAQPTRSSMVTRSVRNGSLW